MPITKTKHVQLFWNDSQQVTFHELKWHLQLGYNWLHIWGVMIVLSVLVLRKVRENWWNLSTFSLLLEKPKYKNPRRFLYRVKHTKFALIFKESHSSLPYLQRNFILKCCRDLCAMWKIMHRVYLQYLSQYVTKFKSVFFILQSM